MKIGDKVRLNRKGIKAFYGTEDLLKCHEYPNGEFNFVDFVNNYTGFENGKSIGIITGFSDYSKDVRKVTFFGVLSSDFGYYEIEYLTKVR